MNIVRRLSFVVLPFLFVSRNTDRSLLMWPNHGQYVFFPLLLCSLFSLLIHSDTVDFVFFFAVLADTAHVVWCWMGKWNNDNGFTIKRYENVNISHLWSAYRINYVISSHFFYNFISWHWISAKWIYTSRKSDTFCNKTTRKKLVPTIECLREIFFSYTVFFFSSFSHDILFGFLNFHKIFGFSGISILTLLSGALTLVKRFSWKEC